MTPRPILLNPERRARIIRANAKAQYLEMVTEYVSQDIRSPRDLASGDFVAIAHRYLKSKTALEQGELLQDVDPAELVKFMAAPAGDEDAARRLGDALADCCAGDIRADFKRIDEESRGTYASDVEAMLDHGMELHG